MAYTHSRFWINLLLFFPSSGKVYKPLNHQKIDISKERSKEGKLCSFSSICGIFVVLFFFPKFFCNLLFFFFPGKVYSSLTHSISKAGKKKQPRKKKTPFLLTHTIFSKKWPKSNFSREKKNTVPLTHPPEKNPFIRKFKLRS